MTEALPEGTTCRNGHDLARTGHIVENRNGHRRIRCRQCARDWAREYTKRRPDLSGGKVVLICLQVSQWDHRQPAAAEFTSWASIAEAREAAHQLCRPRCGPGCAGEHMIVAADSSGIHVEDASQRNGETIPAPTDIESRLHRP
jgi:transposase-like protein